MSAFEFIPDGGVRIRTLHLRAGEKYYETLDGKRGTYRINEPCLVDIEELYKGGEWSCTKRLWDTLRPEKPVELSVAPGGAPTKTPGFFARLFRRNNIPKATLVKG